MSQSKKQQADDSHEIGETNFAKDPLADKIGSSLRRMYDDVVNQPVPDEFLNLLIEADKKSN